MAGVGGGRMTNDMHLHHSHVDAVVALGAAERGHVGTRAAMVERVVARSRRRRSLLVRILRALERGDLTLERRSQLAAEIRAEVTE